MTDANDISLLLINPKLEQSQAGVIGSRGNWNVLIKGQTNSVDRKGGLSATMLIVHPSIAEIF